MQLLKKNKLIFIFIFSIYIVNAQSLPSRNISINDGLPSNFIRCFYKDSRGLMWIGTDAGLCSFDGTSYKIYNESNGLKHSQIWSIAEDNDKNLWLSIYSQGLAKFDGKKFTYYDKKDGLINNTIRKIFFSKANNCLVLGTENGLSLFNGKEFKSFILETSLNKFQVVDINESKDKLYFTVSFDNVYSINFNTELKKSTIKKEFTPVPSYSSLIHDSKFYGGIEKLSIKDLKSNDEKSYQCPIIWDYAIDNSNNIYCATWRVTTPNGGLFQYANNEIIDITKKANMPSAGLWCLYFDKTTNQLWIGSIDKGIFILDLNENINFLSADFFHQDELDVQCLHKDLNNNIWIGAKDKIIFLRPDKTFKIIKRENLWNKIDKYLLAEINKNKGLKDVYDSYKSKNNFKVFNITHDKDNNIWFATSDGYFCLNKNFDLLSHYFTDGGHIIFGDKDELVFSAMYAYTTLKKEKFDKSEGTIYSLKDLNTPRDVVKVLKHKGIVWYGSDHGLYNYVNGKFHSLNISKQFTEKNINYLAVNDKDQLIIGTNSGKVFIANWQNNKLEILNIYEPNKHLYGTSIFFVEQIHGAYFIGTNKGINVIKDNKFVKLLNKHEGLNNIHFNDCIKDSNGNLLIATNTSIIEVNTLKCLEKENFSNTIVLNSIKVNGDKNDDRIDNWINKYHKTLKYEYNQNNLEIHFTTNNLYNAEKGEFRYKIVGLSNVWINLENNQKIQLLGIPDGKYTILVEGKNIGTGIVYQPLKVDFIINPPFWKTLWFIFLILIMLLIVGILLIRKRISQIKSQEQVKKRLAETKLEALQSQMNPHFIFNAMNSIQNYIIDNDTNDALMYLGEFSKLMRQTLNNSSKSRITLADEIDYLESYVRLEKMRYKDSVNFVISIDAEIDINEMYIPPMILQPLIENVFIHAFDSKSLNPTIEVSFTILDDWLICKIRDNGKGFNTDINGHASKGIKLIKERLNLIQGSVKNSILINSFPMEGTLVSIKFKLKFEDIQYKTKH